MALSDVTKRIIFKNGEGGIAISTPSPEFLENHTIEDVAKTLPVGVKYKIVDLNDAEVHAFLSDRTFRDAWDIDEEDLTDGVGEGARFDNQ